MRKSRMGINDEMALAELLPSASHQATPSVPPPADVPASDWVRIVRTYLRMTQAELAARARVTQSHVAAIEAGKIDPQLGTLKRVFAALSCDLAVQPKPKKGLSEVLRGRGRAIALKRLKRSTGTMAMEEQAPDAAVFRALLEKRTDEILADPREKLWNKKDDDGD